MQTQFDEGLDYRSLGLIANPFLPVTESADSIGVRLAIRAAALSAMSAIDAAADDPEHRPVMIDKSDQVPSYYHLAAFAEMFQHLMSGSPVSGVLPVLVPVDMMRLGRVRAALSMLAERVAYATPEVALARWARAALSEPDTSLSEWAAVSALDVDAVLARIEADEHRFGTDVFGSPVGAREGAEDAETLMRVAGARQRLLEADPEEDAEKVAPVQEEALDDPLSEAFVTPLVESEPDAGPSEDDLIAEYVIAYIHTHVSPVVARGALAYRAQGISSMAQELKITKAPSKTLAALLRFASVRFRAAAIIYDRFDLWDNAPVDLRMKIIGTLTQQRWTIKDHGLLVLAIDEGLAPELRESFAGATRVSWSFGEVERVFNDGVAFDAAAAASWIDAAGNGVTPSWAGELLAAVPDGVAIEDGCRALADAIDEAAKTGTAPDPQRVAASLAEMEDVASE